jgi:hypothetical protein
VSPEIDPSPFTATYLDVVPLGNTAALRASMTMAATNGARSGYMDVSVVRVCASYKSYIVALITELLVFLMLC